jgi:branched-chain amino acid aminotransferase
MNFVCFNGEIVRSDQPLFTAQNRSFKYGDAVFETIKVYNGNILLAGLHFERLFMSLKLLKLPFLFDEMALHKSIIQLCEKNECSQLARVRLAVYRDENDSSGFVVEANSLSTEANAWNDKGLRIDLYPYARKSKDAFANLKTANFLAYVLAGLHAKENKLDDCIVLNSDSNLCDSSKANIFLVKEEKIFTPALHQGCINGVMRRFLIDGLKGLQFSLHQQEIKEEDLINADEVFLTNAIYGMRWIESFRNKKYTNTVSVRIYRQLLSTVYQ